MIVIFKAASKDCSLKGKNDALFFLQLKLPNCSFIKGGKFKHFLALRKRRKRCEYNVKKMVDCRDKQTPISIYYASLSCKQWVFAGGTNDLFKKAIAQKQDVTSSSPSKLVLLLLLKNNRQRKKVGIPARSFDDKKGDLMVDLPSSFLHRD